MGHYAKVRDGVVVDVIVAEADFFNHFVDTSAGQWVKTSYNMRGGKYIDPATGEEASDQSIVTGDEARERKNYAGVGWNYDGTGFYPPKPFDSWVFDSSTYLWNAPVSYPNDGNDYEWDESAYQADTADPKTAGWTLLT